MSVLEYIKNLYQAKPTNSDKSKINPSQHPQSSIMQIEVHQNLISQHDVVPVPSVMNHIDFTRRDVVTNKSSWVDMHHPHSMFSHRQDSKIKSVRFN